MSKNRPKLKSLFLFNGLLFVIAFALIQYSVVSHEHEGSIEGQGKSQKLYDPALKGDFKRIEMLNHVDLPYNIPFKNILGRDLYLDGLKGQWIVLNFWATWCPPCIKEMPSLQNLQDIYSGQNVKVVGISLDRNMDGQKLRAFMNRYQFGPVAAYYGEFPFIKQHFEIPSLPITYILSPSGHVVARMRYVVDWASEDAKAFIESLVRN